jgi:GT2 family glycosyltransferase
VVIASYNSSATVRECLESLRQQNTRHDFEIIVVDSSPDDTRDLIAREFSEVVLIARENRHYCGEARNLGIEHSRGEIIALTDADCVVDADWIDKIVANHDAPHGVVAGSIANALPSNTVGWAAYFCEFSQWMPVGRERWIDDAPGANITYKAETIAELGSFIEGTYCSDTEFHWRLSAAGQRILFVPEIRVWHRSIDRIGRYLKHEFEHGRFFARVRSRGQRFSTLRRWLYALLFWLIPARLMLRVVTCQLRTPETWLRFLAASPLVAAGLVAWSTGECAGYVRGPSSHSGSD